MCVYLQKNKQALMLKNVENNQCGVISYLAEAKILNMYIV
jgi:hypothetical protein